MLCGVLTIAIGGARRNQGGAAWDGDGRAGAFFFGLLASLFLALGNLFRKLGVSAIPSSSVGVFVGSLSALSVLSVFLLITGPGILRQALRHLDRDYAVSGLSTSVALYFLFTSLQMIPLSIANSLTAAEPVYAVAGTAAAGQAGKAHPGACGRRAGATVLGAVLLACFLSAGAAGKCSAGSFARLAQLRGRKAASAPGQVPVRVSGALILPGPQRGEGAALILQQQQDIFLLAGGGVEVEPA